MDGMSAYGSGLHDSGIQMDCRVSGSLSLYGSNLDTRVPHANEVPFNRTQRQSTDMTALPVTCT